jgi:hypothetical protein
MAPFEWVLLCHDWSSFSAFSPTLTDQLSSCNTVGFFSLETAWRTVQGYEVIDNIQHVT